MPSKYFEVTWQGKECSDKARDMFLELGDKEGLQIVDEVHNSAQF